MRKLFSCIIAAALGFWAAATFVSGVKIKVLAGSSFFGIPLTADWHLFLALSVILGLLNYFVKPILNAITLPLRVISLGLFEFVINMALIWIIDVMFAELSIQLWLPLLYTSLIIFGLTLITSGIISKK